MFGSVHGLKNRKLNNSVLIKSHKLRLTKPRRSRFKKYLDMNQDSDIYLINNLGTRVNSY